MLECADRVLSHVTPTQWVIYTGIALVILLSDTIWNVLNRAAGKDRFVRIPVCEKLALIYTAFILLVTLFIRRFGSGGRLAWMPLWSWQEVLMCHNLQLLWEILLNILLFVPLGGLLTLNRAWSAKETVLMGFGLSIFIELCQLVFRLGLFEWDDILHNGMGCALGMLGGRLCRDFLRRVKNR